MKWSYIRWIYRWFPELGWLRLYVWIVWEIPFIQGDSSRDLFIPKRWRLRFTSQKVTKITVPKRSQSQNCQGYRLYHWKKAYLTISIIHQLLGTWSIFDVCGDHVTSNSNMIYLAILCDLFGMVIRDPFQWWIVTSNVWGWSLVTAGLWPGIWSHSIL